MAPKNENKKEEPKKNKNGTSPAPSQAASRRSSQISTPRSSGGIAPSISEALTLSREMNVDMPPTDEPPATYSPRVNPSPVSPPAQVPPVNNILNSIYFTSPQYSNVLNAVPLMLLSSINDAPNNNNDILKVNEEVKFYLRNVLKTEQDFKEMINTNNYDNVRIAFIDQVEELKKYQMSKNNLLVAIHMLRKLFNGYQYVVPDLIHLIVNINYTKDRTDIVELVSNFINNCARHIVSVMTTCMVRVETPMTIPDSINGQISSHQYDLTTMYNLTFAKARSKTYYKYTQNNASVVSKPHNIMPGFALYKERFNVEQVVCELNI
ncbi:ORF42 protein [Operophtera brumata nucleopolyhedrovirus]|uniref:ORF42 protein n=1 Tax=Operophtera brumata nucleopolyhedrovirus TaxID=1046267 RepID=A0A2H4UZP5_9ABAC|nr:ORF42 protein [Operophtera brumata nucleopolyhedrovirus]AUA60273.1 ORF42 protein [Operophtera brumata nucleopolyhedrovirus]